MSLYGADYLEDILEELGENVYAILGVMAAVIGLILVFALLSYIFRSVSLYSIAKRRGIDNYGLAWLPVAWNWILGCIADKHDARDKRSYKWRHVLLWTAFAAFAGGIILSGYNLSFTVKTAANGLRGAAGFDEAYLLEMLSGLGALFIGELLIFLATLINNVCAYIAFFKLYESCRPKRPVLLFVLSCIIPFAQPIILLCCRNYDYGVKAGSELPTLPDNGEQDRYGEGL